MKLLPGKMNYNISGKGIFVFSDPAGANAVLAIIDILIRNGKIPGIDFNVFTDKNGFFSKEYKDIVEVKEFIEEKVKNIIGTFHPDYLFSATSLNNFEHQWRILATKQNIKTMAFIDHWTNYLERFMFHGETVFANEIWVVNETARKEAIKAGIPENLLIVSGNPYYEKVRRFKPEISKRNFFAKHHLNTAKKTILFISDNIRDSFPKDEKGSCILGFDEHTVLQDILIGFAELEKQINFEKYQLIIKFHPRSHKDKFNVLIEKYKPKNLDVFCIQDCDPLTINHYSDYVIGMFSNMVIESLLMRNKVLRVQIGQKGSDLMKFEIENTVVVLNREELTLNLLKLLNK